MSRSDLVRMSTEELLAQKVSRPSYHMMDKSKALEGDLVLKVVKESNLPANPIMAKGGPVKVLLTPQMRTSVGMAAPVTLTKVSLYLLF